MISKPIKKLATVLFTVALFSSNATASGQVPNSFSKSKKLLYTKVYENQGQTFYTGCQWQKKKVDLSSCGLENSFSKSQTKRAHRFEAEHVIPASWLYKKQGEYRECYLAAKNKNISPRKFCQENDSDYRNAHNDLVNLRPSVGAINAARSNKPFSEIMSGTKETTYRGHGKKIVIASRVVIPDVSIRGDIARIAFYMKNTYGASYSKRQLELFKKWNAEDPISDEERHLDMKIKSIQGFGFLDNTQ